MTLVFPRREAEAQAFLDANPDIESVHVIWTDMCGVARGKVLRRDEVVPAWKDGRFMPISALVLDVTGQDVPETGLVFDEGDRDMLMWPAPGSLGEQPASAITDGRPRAAAAAGAAPPEICRRGVSGPGANLPSARERAHERAHPLAADRRASGRNKLHQRGDV